MNALNTVKTIARILACLFGLLLLATGAAPAQVGPSTHYGAVTDDAKHFLDSIADVSRGTRTERGACLHSYWVENDTLTFVHWKPSAPFVSDSTHIVWATEPCPRGMSVLHTHVAKWSDSTGHLVGVNPQPSPDDMLSTRFRGTWGILLVVMDTGWKVVVYP
jgi:hypothetical protein